MSAKLAALVLALAHLACLARAQLADPVADRFSTECKTLGGQGSLLNECVVSKSQSWIETDVVTVGGPGNITIGENVTLAINIANSQSSKDSGGFNITIGGHIELLPGAAIIGPTVYLFSKSLVLHERSALNASGLGDGFRGTPFKNEYGAGYGGTGAACNVDAKMSRGACYGWTYDFSGVSFPFSQRGGGSHSAGRGGGRIYLETEENITLAGTIEANGLGSYLTPGGGGSGGSITILSTYIVNNSTDYNAAIQASGGPGTTVMDDMGSSMPSGGGGGGRISVTCRQQFDSSISLQAAGGRSTDNCTIGGSLNNGGAGTIFLSEKGAYGGGDQLHISNNGRGTESLNTNEATALGVFPESSLDKFVLQYFAVAEMSMDLTSTEILARQVEMTSSSSLLFGNRNSYYPEPTLASEGRGVEDDTESPGGSMLVGLTIKADSFSMSNSVMDIHAGFLEYGGLYTTAGSFNLSDSSVVTIVAQTSSSTVAVSKILGSVSITSGSSLISDGKLFLSPFYQSEATVEIGSGTEEVDQQNIIAASYITFMGYKNVSISQNSQVFAPCTASVSKACSAFDPCSKFGAYCPDREDPCSEITKGFWTVAFCKLKDTLHIAGGLVTGSNVYVEDTPEVTVTGDGAIIASFGCTSGSGPGNGTGNSINGAGGGAGHGGFGGNGTFGFNQTAEGGLSYGSKLRPCENGSGGGSGEQPGGRGGGTIRMGSRNTPVSKIYLEGKISANGQNAQSSSSSGGGGGSGGSILFFADSFSSDSKSVISAMGGNASFSGGGGGGGGGRIHFEWTIDRDMGREEILRYGYHGPPIVPCNVSVDGGVGSKNGTSGGGGTETTIQCPKGRTGIFCAYCPLGTYKDVEGPSPCKPCQAIPRKANYSQAYGITSYPCSYGCYSYNLRSDCALPNALLDLITRVFGGTLRFIGIFWGFVLLTALISGSIKSGLTKGGRKRNRTPRGFKPFFMPDKFSTGTHSPLLESLDEVLTNEESVSMDHYEDFTLRIHFEGTGSVHDPWKLNGAPPQQLKKNMIIESQYLHFVESCNAITMSEGIDQLGVFGLLKILCPPIAWKWKNRHRKVVLDNLQYFIESEEGHCFLRSARSRALLDVLRFGHSKDLTLAYFDLHITIHELQSSIKNARHIKFSNQELLHQKLPFVIMFAGEGSFLSPYNLQLPSSDYIQQFLCETLSPLVWAKLVGSLNMQFQNTLRSTLEDDIEHLQTFIDKNFESYLASYDMKASLYVSNLHTDACQIGLLIQSLRVNEAAEQDAAGGEGEFAGEGEMLVSMSGFPGSQATRAKRRKSSPWRTVRIYSAIKKIFLCAQASFPDPRMQATLGLLIFFLVSLDGFVTIYMLIEVFALKEIFVLSLLVPPLSILASPFNGMFQLVHQSRSNMAAAVRLHNIWNMCSMASVLVVLAGQLIRLGYSDNFDHIAWFHSQSTFFFLVPLALLLEKILQVLLVNIFAASICIAELKKS